MMSGLRRFVPKAWLDRSPILAGVVDAMSVPMDIYRAAFEAPWRFFTARNAPADWLPWMLYEAGVPAPIINALNEAQRRRVLAVAFKVWQAKGTTDGVDLWAKAIDIDATVVWYEPEEFIAGVSLANDVCGTVTPHWHFEVRVPTGSISEVLLRFLLEPVVPGYCTYDVIFT
jgi:hypothetical protein